MWPEFCRAAQGGPPELSRPRLLHGENTALSPGGPISAQRLRGCGRPEPLTATWGGCPPSPRDASRLSRPSLAAMTAQSGVPHMSAQAVPSPGSGMPPIHSGPPSLCECKLAFQTPWPGSYYMPPSTPQGLQPWGRPASREHQWAQNERCGGDRLVIFAFRR
ncbi:unnamed protein product [Rangifer tarandus platyrhynchus]|uniref:Uncharacterized protein n=1 Tax=Rangifer tarandus platyrhynchus TaxID=3082113 RepID=A0ABN8ZRC5_RANTA|nr:unnamed protein product [Rangifer tarandus platyrhynchus]